MERAETAGTRKCVHVLIVGAGCFGLSTAYHLLADNESSELGAQESAPWYKVTVIDASDILPAPDAASTDLNKIVRTSYSDGWYTRFAKEAIAKWKEGDICGKDTYHESGVLVLGLRDQSTESPDYATKLYADAGLRNDREINARIEVFLKPGISRRALPNGVVGGRLFDEGGAYLNSDGGWASASKAMEAILENVKKLGGDVRTGCKLSGISSGADGTTAVTLENGEVIQADIVILTTGAWTPHIVGGIPQLKDVFKNRLIATGQVVATLRPSPYHQQQLRKSPVLLDWQSGFYMFPPNEEGLIKIALHTEGHTFVSASSQDSPELQSNQASLVDVVSRPRTVRTHGEGDGKRVPRHILQHLHSKLGAAYPELAKVPLETTRLCWYTESPDENWFIDQVPGHPALFIATGDSGHAFKFLPVIGRLVKQRIEGRLPPSDAAKFSLCREFGAGLSSRLGQPVALDEAALWGPNEFNEYIAGVTKQSD